MERHISEDYQIDSLREIGEASAVDESSQEHSREKISSHANIIEQICLSSSAL